MGQRLTQLLILALAWISLLPGRLERNFAVTESNKGRPQRPKVIIAGLGPGDPSHLTRAVWEEIKGSSEVYARIGQHPALKIIPDSVTLKTFEDYYDNAETYELLYNKISNRILELAKEKRKLLYLVPGDPWVGETTTKLIVNQSSLLGVDVDVLPGVSFVEPTLASLGVDMLPRLTVGDSYELIRFQHLPMECNTPLLISQLEDRFEASTLKIVLMTTFSPQHRVALVHAAGSFESKVEWLPLQNIDRSEEIGIMTSLYIPAACGSFNQLRDAVANKRNAMGDDWDEMTHTQLSAELMDAARKVAKVSENDPPNSTDLSESLASLFACAVAHLQLGEDDCDLTARDVLARASEIAADI